MKKGQVTLFVIIGLILLLIVGLFLMRPADRQPSSLQATQEKARVTQFIQTCLANTGEEVLRDMGTRGWYTKDAAQKFKTSPKIRESQTASLPAQTIVLWHEISPCTDSPAGCLYNNRPPLCASGDSACPVPTAASTNSKATSIQEQLEIATAAKIDKCLNFKNAFPDITIEKTGTPKVRALIREQDVGLTLNYPIVITTSDKQLVDIKETGVRLSVALPRMYRFATKIQDTERNIGFIENAFLHLLSVYSGRETEIPPIRDIQLFGGEKIWIRTRVQERIEQDILPYMNFLQLINAQEGYTPILSGDNSTYGVYADGVYQYLTVKLDNQTVPMDARFEYPGTPMFLDINGREVLKPNQLSGGGFLAAFSSMLFTQYKFKYTLAFPVVVHLNDPAAFDGRGYQMDFGLKASVKNNYPQNVSQPSITLTAGQSSLDLSDPSQLVKHTYQLTLTDHLTGEPISEASVNYECGGRFFMGNTDGSGIWTGQLPYCMSGGALTVQKYGYASTGQAMTNTEDDGVTSTLAMSLWPSKEKTIILYKLTTADVGNISLGFSQTAHRTLLGVNDSVVMQMARIKTTPYDDDIPMAGVLQFGTQGGASASTRGSLMSLRGALNDALKEGGMSQKDYDDAIKQLDDAEQAQTAREASGSSTPPARVEIQHVDLVPGTYELNGMLMYNGLLQLPEKKESRYTIEARNFSSWVSGGVQLTGSDGVSLDKDTIYSDKKIVLYVLEQPLPKTWDEMLNFKDIAVYQTYERKLMVIPTFE